MVFHKHPKVIQVLKIRMNNVEIDRVSEFNFLGVIVDEHITWKPHIEKIRVKISRINISIYVYLLVLCFSYY